MADPAPPRRSLQFRLRTLMIVVTIAAILCPIGIKTLRDRQARRDREAAERLINPHDRINPDATPEMLKKLVDELTTRARDSDVQRDNSVSQSFAAKPRQLASGR
jgi:hypothetical protein